MPEGGISEIIESPSDLRLFKVDTRMGGEGEEGDQSKLREEVTQILKQQKLEFQLESYFATELYKQHAVDKKI